MEFYGRKGNGQECSRGRRGPRLKSCDVGGERELKEETRSESTTRLPRLILGLCGVRFLVNDDHLENLCTTEEEL